jgi:hypothetical protein
MNLTDILRKINEEEEDKGQSTFTDEYDFAIIPSDIQAALDALSNLKNYGIYSKNLANQAERTKVFGPSIPAQKAGAAWKDWDTLSPKEKLLKIEEIKARVERKSDGKESVTFDNIGEKVWSNTLSLLAKSKDYAAWMEENGDNPEDYLVTLNGKQANDFNLFGSRGSAYFPQKLGDEEVKYKPLQQDQNFIVVNNKIVFPLEKSPYKPKKYLRKVISLIMDNAGVDFEEDKKYQLDTTKPSVEKSKPETSLSLTTTVNSADQADKLRKLLQAKLGDVTKAKYEVETTGEGAERKYKLVVTGITASQRAAIQPLTFDFKKAEELRLAKEKLKADKVKKINESNSLEMRAMLVRAGIIK